MPATLKPFCAAVVAASLAGLFSAEAAAQDAAIQFRVVATDRNPSACKQFDAALSRVHTFTATGDSASLRSAGGITSNMAQTTPRVYTTNFSLGGTTLNVVADASKSPKTLVVTEPRLGCRWNAVAP
jgi:hypothetical protein